MSVQLPTRTIDPKLAELIAALKPGDRIAVTQTVRVGSRKWEAVIKGVYRSQNYLGTGLMTERVKADDVVVPVLHFTKDNGELTSVTLDEHTRLIRE